MIIVKRIAQYNLACPTILPNIRLDIPPEYWLTTLFISTIYLFMLLLLFKQFPHIGEYADIRHSADIQADSRVVRLYSKCKTLALPVKWARAKQINLRSRAKYASREISANRTEKARTPSSKQQHHHDNQLRAALHTVNLLWAALEAERY